MTDTIETADGRQIPVTDDPAAIDTYATGLTVALGQKVNLGNYENAEPYASIRAEVRPALSLAENANVEALREQAERLKRVVAWQVSSEVERFRGDNGGER